jgi:centromeric protein E
MDSLLSLSGRKLVKTDLPHAVNDTDFLKTAGFLGNTEDDPYSNLKNKECEGVQNDLVSTKENVHVYVRVRPFLEKVHEVVIGRNIREIQCSSYINFSWKVDEEGLVNNKKCVTYQFESVFNPSITNQDVFQLTLKETVTAGLRGYDGSVFCYGQTGSGKTHTMYGDESDSGIAVRALEYLFKSIENSKAQHKVTISFFEIYNESINDLLDNNKKNLKFIEVAKGLVNIKGITKCACETFNEAIRILKVGDNNKHMGISKINDKSSRSHTM